MQEIVVFIHIAVSILLLPCIALQHRASGLSATFGGAGVTVVQRRGAEKVLYKISIWLSILFFGLTILRWFI